MAMDHPSGLAIIASKIAPEPQGRTTLTRERLVGWLEQQDDARVVARLGGGRLRQVHAPRRVRSSERAVPCVWYRMEVLRWRLADVPELHGRHASRRSIPASARQTEALLRHVAAMGSSRELVVAQFLAELGDLRGRAPHRHPGRLPPGRRVGGRSAHHESAAGARPVRHAGSSWRCVVGQSLLLGRLAARGTVAELTTEDLRFSRLRDRGSLQDHAGSAARPACVRCGRRAHARLGGQPAARIGVDRGRADPSEVGAFIEALRWRHRARSMTSSQRRSSTGCRHPRSACSFTPP